MNIPLKISLNTSLSLIRTFDRKHACLKGKMYLKVEVSNYFSEILRSVGPLEKSLFSSLPWDSFVL